MPVHFSPHEMAARKRRLLAAMADARLDGMLLFAQESTILADRLRHVRLLLLPVPLCRRRRAHGPAHPLGRFAPGAAHL